MKLTLREKNKKLIDTLKHIASVNRDREAVFQYSQNPHTQESLIKARVLAGLSEDILCVLEHDDFVFLSTH